MKRLVVLMIFSSVIALSYVLVSVKPLFLMTKEIYEGDVKILIDPHVNPHTFQLNPSSMRKIERADVLVVLGGGFEEWLSRIKGVKICRLSDVLGIAPKINPHVWLDPVLDQAMAVKLEGCLEEIYPKESEKMRINLVAFLKKLSDLEEKIGSDLSRKDKPILELRPALYHFAKRFLRADYTTLVGQSQASLSPRKLRDILKMCRKENIRYVLVEKNSSRKIAQPVVRACKLKIIEVDVLGTDANSFEGLLKSVEKSVEEALR